MSKSPRDARDSLMLQLSLREIYAKTTMFYYGGSSPSTPQQRAPDPATTPTGPAARARERGEAAAPTRRWELAELDAASAPPPPSGTPAPPSKKGKRKRPPRAPDQDEKVLIFSPPFKFVATADHAESYEDYDSTATAGGSYYQSWSSWEDSSWDHAPVSDPASASDGLSKSSSSSSNISDALGRPLTSPRAANAVPRPARRPSVVDPL